MSTLIFFVLVAIMYSTHIVHILMQCKCVLFIVVLCCLFVCFLFFNSCINQYQLSFFLPNLTHQDDFIFQQPKIVNLI